MGQLNEFGYQIDTWDDIKLKVQNVFTSAYGPDIDLSDPSPEGVLVNKLTDLFNDSEQSGVDQYNAFNINNSNGTMLSNIAILRQAPRHPGTVAILNVTLTSQSSPYTIPASTTFDILTTSLKYQNPYAISVVGLTQTAQLIATAVGLSGAIVGDPNLGSLQSETYISQLADITINTIIEGVGVEDDITLINRLNTTSSPNAKSGVEDIYTGLLTLPNVTDCNVLENTTASTDANQVTAYSICAIVLGGIEADIINMIYNKNAPGTPTCGNKSASLVDEMGNTRTIKYDIAGLTQIYIRTTVTAKDGQLLVDGSANDTIIQNCIDYISRLKIGRKVSYTTLYGFFSNPQTFDIVTFEISKDNSNWVSTNLVINVRNKSYLTANQITITVS